jgi:hypothetical protein
MAIGCTVLGCQHRSGLYKAPERGGVYVKSTLAPLLKIAIIHVIHTAHVYSSVHTPTRSIRYIYVEYSLSPRDFTNAWCVFFLR